MVLGLGCPPPGMTLHVRVCVYVCEREREQSSRPAVHERGRVRTNLETGDGRVDERAGNPMERVEAAEDAEMAGELHKPAGCMGRPG